MSNHDPVPQPSLSAFSFEALQAGMKFNHPEYGEQIILDLGRGQFGPTIRFHNSRIYSGQIPDYDAAGDLDIYQRISSSIYPYRAEDWQYAGEAGQEELTTLGFGWYQVVCPHCGFIHRLLASEPNSEFRSCRGCGMTFNRPVEPDMTPGSG